MPDTDVAAPAEYRPRPYPVELVTIQFAWGGLLDFKPADDLIHINARYSETSSATLCGQPLFGEDAPGWSRGGGVTGPTYRHVPCPECRDAAAERFPDLTVTGGAMFKLDWSKP